MYVKRHMNVKSVKLTVNEHTLTWCNSNSRWSLVAYERCFEISLMCRMRSSTLYMLKMEISGKFEFILEKIGRIPPNGPCIEFPR